MLRQDPSRRDFFRLERDQPREGPEAVHREGQAAADRPGAAVHRLEPLQRRRRLRRRCHPAHLRLVRQTGQQARKTTRS